MIQTLTPTQASPLTARQNMRVGRIVRAAETGRLLQRPRIHRRYPPMGIGTALIDALVDQWELVEPNFWKYAWREARRLSGGRWEIKPGGKTSIVDGDPFARAAYNAYETNNDGVGPEGAGGTYGVVGSSMREMLPIMVGAWIQIFVRRDELGQDSYNFARENAPEVSCV